MAEKHKQETADQLKDVSMQLRTLEDSHKDAEDEIFFLKDQVKEIHADIKVVNDKLLIATNEVSISHNLESIHSYVKHNRYRDDNKKD